MAKPNFQFQKRQKELERKKKMEEKLQRKLAKKDRLPGSIESTSPGGETE
ncbi:MULTISPECIES: hypothetical protein [Geobacter]|uniref:Uncharacterized protein n=1 Tax=Geobacter anodireducens TaxID=1340425 RepID=A0ABR9NZ12_9BACT|nr:MULTISPECIES: hypothetical protein [Geobacter]ANA39154.1 hypothetical protein A2G06_00715 [Geobacter anodireducens]MBE2889506.1 hypothetical protein [Geobacter anodireducens]